ncbi:FAD dependent oxidoreductase [Lophiostoma macrostomum CBS 122681]|uniref:FAD dependent oxidoreductase n=1 Tax=Lophiostoma macrostomum CBS 122681 TaxID=1314788 RepID=A0A6A6THI7_9PLEO|nr:FAD dependent oxidoreductase [Lophiostoma macrostomum CBS 122681]
MSSPHLSPPTNTPIIIIIGAGSIGLWTAYHLAKSRLSSESIIVLEATPSAFGATSGTCSGCIHYHFSDPHLIDLGKFSFDLWEDLATDEGFRQAVRWSSRSLLGLKKGVGSLEGLPGWFKRGRNGDHEWCADEGFLGFKNALVDPKGVGTWLEKACLDLGVQICTSTIVTAAALNDEALVAEVTVSSLDKPDKAIACTSLILACGPWTPSVYATLFPNSALRFDQVLEAGDWLLLRNPHPVAGESTIFVGLNEFVGSKLEFAGRDDGTIWICGRKIVTSSSSLPEPGKCAKADTDMASELIGRCSEFLGRDDLRAEKKTASVGLEIVETGRAFRPTSRSGLPLIAKVKPMALSESRKGNVFVNWGHGSYGLTLGPVSGRLMAQTVRQDAPDIDLSPFCLPGETLEVNLGEQIQEKPVECNNKF